MKELQNIADAINDDSRKDRRFAYTLTGTLSIVSIVVGFTMWNLINTLATNMNDMSINMAKMSKDMTVMSNNVSQMTIDVNSMSKETHRMNKMNPMRFF